MKKMSLSNFNPHNHSILSNNELKAIFGGKKGSYQSSSGSSQPSGYGGPGDIERSGGGQETDHGFSVYQTTTIYYG